MANRTDTYSQVTTSGWVVFAATMALIAGLMNIVYGLVVLFNDEWAVLTPEGVVFADITAWGWILILVGAVQMLIAGGISSGQTWARIVGILWASLNVIGLIGVIGVYPVWGLAIMAINILLIYGLAVHGGEVAGR